MFPLVETVDNFKKIAYFLFSLTVDLLRLAFFKKSEPTHESPFCNQVVVLNWKEKRFHEIMSSFSEQYLDNYFFLTRNSFPSDSISSYHKSRPLTLGFYQSYFKLVPLLVRAVARRTEEKPLTLQFRYLTSSVIELYHVICFLEIYIRFTNIKQLVVLQDCFYSDSVFVQIANKLGIESITLQHALIIHPICVQDTDAKVFAFRNMESCQMHKSALPSSTRGEVYDYTQYFYNKPQPSKYNSHYSWVYYDTNPPPTIDKDLWRIVKAASKSKPALFKFRPGCSWIRKLRFLYFFFNELITGRIKVTNNSPRKLFGMHKFTVSFSSSVLFECKLFPTEPIMLLPSIEAYNHLDPQTKSSYQGLTAATAEALLRKLL